MQLRIRNTGTSTDRGTINRFMKVSSSFFLAGSLMVALPMTTEAFVPSSLSQNRVPSTQMLYTMQDVTSMKSGDMKQELESYGINTRTLFDKHEFEQALIEARHHYEQTLNDVMSSTRPKEKKAKTRQRTVNYDRDRHGDERIYSSDVNDQPGQQRRRTHYQAEPNPVGFGACSEPNPVGFGNVNPNTSGGGRHRPGNDWFEQDPLFAHEKQAQHFEPNGHGDHFDYHNEHYEEYTVGGRQPEAQATYNDPAKEMKYQAALQYAYNMKVEDLQHELNCRGISTNNCMIVKDFCVEYATAVADGKAKIMENPSSASDNTVFGDDSDDYDPTYRDVVMKKYDPSMWV